MDIDVLYRIPKDIAWQYINTYISKSSLDLAVFRACPDSFVSKKTIWNLISRLKRTGFICVQCEPEFVSDIIKIFIDKKYNYTVTYFFDENRIYTYVISSKVKIRNFDIFVKINSWEDIAYALSNLTQYRFVCTFVGDACIPMAAIFKSLCRRVICFGADNFYCKYLLNNGISEICPM